MAWLSITLDYGCGSGILAIAAAKLGAMAPELLPAGTYDVVLANILAGPLIAQEPLAATEEGWALVEGQRR